MNRLANMPNGKGCTHAPHTPDRLDEALFHQLLHLPPRVLVIRLQITGVLAVRVLGPQRRVVDLAQVRRPMDQQLLDLGNAQLFQDPEGSGAHVLAAVVVVPELRR